MTARLLTLTISAALLTLYGCASQQKGVDPLEAANQRLGSLEAQLQSESGTTLARIAQLGRQVDTLNNDVRGLRETAASQASAAAAAHQALSARLEQTEQRLREQARENEARLARLAAQLDQRLMEQTQTLQAETAELDERLEDTEAELEALSSLLADGLARTEAMEAALPGLTEKIDAGGQRFDQVAAQAKEALAQTAAMQTALAALRERGKGTGEMLNRLAARIDQRDTEQSMALQAETAELDERLEDTEAELEALAGQLSDGLARTEAMEAALPDLSAKIDAGGQRLDQVAAQTSEALAQATTLQAALPSLREQAAAAGSRMNDYDARLAALAKRLEEVAAMAQDALDATGLGQRKLFGKVLESVTLTEDKTLFPINSPNLGEQDKAKLDALALRLKALGTNYHLQIQGHTEGLGAEDSNYALGKARAEVVKNYLNEKCLIPLFRMSVMSFGAVEAASQSGRSNRRIVVQVMQ